MHDFAFLVHVAGCLSERCICQLSFMTAMGLFEHLSCNNAASSMSSLMQIVAWLLRCPLTAQMYVQSSCTLSYS